MLLGTSSILVFIPLICVFSVIFVYMGVPWIWGRYSRALLERKAIESHALVLTLDDGPGDRLTPAIMRILDEYGITAPVFTPWDDNDDA